jgi:hypothetical protein
MEEAMSDQLPPELERRIDESMERLGERLKEIIRRGIDAHEEAPATETEIEERLRQWIRELGNDVLRMTIGNLDLYRRKGKERCPCCGKGVYWTRYEPRNLITTLGTITLERAYYHHGPCHCGWVPLDERLQLQSTELTPLAEEMVSYLGGFMPFAQACEYLRKYLGIEISTATVNNATVRAGQALRQEQQEAVGKVWDEGIQVRYEGRTPPEHLYVSADGIKHLQPDGQGKELKIAAVYETEVRRTANGETDLHAIDVEYVVAQEAAALAKSAYVLASKRGLHEAQKRILLGDGANWLWNQMASVLRVPDCIEVLDFFHASEYLWHASESAYGQGSTKAQEWAEHACHTLKHEGPQPVLRALGELPVPRTKSAAAIHDALTYFQNQQSRMDYPSYRKQGLQIGSGSAESAVERVVGSRLNQPGMRWNPDRAECVAHVRAAIFSGDRWDRHWSRYRSPVARHQNSWLAACA